VSVFADSELVCRQLTGRYKVKNAGLKPLFVRAQALLRQFDSVRSRTVRREDNCAADELANQAMDFRTTVGEPVRPGPPLPRTRSSRRKNGRYALGSKATSMPHISCTGTRANAVSRMDTWDVEVHGVGRPA
jgi:hypothetical protein